MINRERLINLFLELTKIDSVSREEREMVDRLITEFNEMDIMVKEDDTGVKINGNAGNLIAELPGDENYPAILLSAHLDRVEPGRGIEPVIRDEYIESSGETVLGGDDLIGIAAIIEVLKIIKEEKIFHGPLKIIFSVAEEVGLQGTSNLCEDELKGLDYGLVFDVDGEIGTVVHRAPSQIKFNARIRGKAAHAGINPRSGINAIKISSIAISNMKLGQIDNETTANIGVIKGGKARNIVPEVVELEGEARSHSEEKLLEQQQHMQEIIDRSVRKYGGQVEYDIKKLYQSFAIDSESDIIKMVKMAAGDLGLSFELMASGGGSDANTFNLMGLPAVNLGTGMERVHSTEERVKINNIYKLVELILKILEHSKSFK
ncbi:MAG: M20/M25/M40 family metallo-hydrolase [Halanaerobiales bacterium]